MGRSGTAGKKPGAAPVREKSRAEIQADARERRIEEAVARLGIADDDILLYPKWPEPFRGHSFGVWRDIAYYEMFLGPRHTEWGSLDRDNSEIHYINPDTLDEILKLLPDGSGLEGLRTGLKLYEVGRDSGRSEGYDEGYRDGESAASSDGFY